MKKWLRRLLIGLVVVIGFWVLLGLGLTFTGAPAFKAKAIVLPAVERHGCVPSPSSRCFKMRDGSMLHAFAIAGADGEPIVLMLHGVMSSAAELVPAAQALHEASGAGVVALDLRGHGSSDGRFGDVDYIGQYEDDIADVATALRAENPRRRLILSGHSMGGGVVMRYAAKPGMPPVDGYLLFAPHLGDRSTTTSHEEKAATGSESIVKLQLKRTIGLLMLNTVGITAFNGKGTLYFNVTDGHGPMHYSFRAMVAGVPVDYRAALGADSKPLLILVGSADEVFVAANYPAVATLHPSGRAVVVPGQTHDGILTSPEAIAAAAAWLN